MRVCARPVLIQARQNPSTQKGKWVQGPTPNQEAICRRYLLEVTFLQWSDTWCISLMLRIADRYKVGAMLWGKFILEARMMQSEEEKIAKAGGCLRGAVCGWLECCVSTLLQSRERSLETRLEYQHFPQALTSQG